MGLKILFAGESWTSYTIHVKGFDTFTTSKYEEGVEWIRQALEKGGHEFTFIPGQKVAEEFPFSVEELSCYDVVALSDIGANTFLLSEKTFTHSLKTPNRLKVIRDYVKFGGGLLMIGGYLTFMGIDGKGRYHNTPVEDCLPVIMKNGDDRRECPEGIRPVVVQNIPEIFCNVPVQFPEVLGYNQFSAKTGSVVAMEIDGDPFLVLGTYGKGRTAAFATDCSPHWAPPEFVNWEGYPVFWNNLISYLAAR